jgi:hypothetical protein
MSGSPRVSVGDKNENQGARTQRSGLTKYIIYLAGEMPPHSFERMPSKSDRDLTALGKD